MYVITAGVGCQVTTAVKSKKLKVKRNTLRLAIYDLLPLAFSFQQSAVRGGINEETRCKIQLIILGVGCQVGIDSYRVSGDNCNIKLMIENGSKTLVGNR